MTKLKYLIICLVAFVCSAKARPTFDVMLKLAEDFEQGLRNELEPVATGPYQVGHSDYIYGPVPPPTSLNYPGYSGRVQPIYHGQYPPQYSSGGYSGQTGNPSVPLYPGTYPQHGYYTQQGPYPPNNNYIQGPYEYPDPNQYGSNHGYGHVSSNSYSYGGKSGYKNMGY